MSALRKLVELRNDLAHRASDVAFRGHLATRMATCAARLLEGLEPLRRAGLTYLLDASAEGGDVFEGRAQRFHGLNPVPEHERIRWVGVAKIRHLYFEVDGHLLDPSPFLSRGILPGSRSESILLWKGFGARGDVAVGDDEATLESWQAPGGTDPQRIIPFQRLARTRGADERTRHAVVSGDSDWSPPRRPSSLPALARAQSERTRSEPVPHERSRRWPFLFAGGVLAGAVAVLAFTWRRDVPSDPGGLSEHPRPLEAPAGPSTMAAP
ncbi:MAG: hypothetical protein JNJ59_14530, partial [Deltaproteobacteria bacterium]|nr:hypothetical protein [Deltaproteobacteria bacterium]